MLTDIALGIITLVAVAFFVGAAIGYNLGYQRCTRDLRVPRMRRVYKG